MRRRLAGLAPFYAAGLLIAWMLKRYYSHAGAEDLEWILGPTAWLTHLLTGASFEWLPREGWVSHEHRFILAPGCAGLNFLIIAFCAFFFSMVHRLSMPATRALWLFASLGIALVLTLATNTLRVIAAIRLYECDIYGGALTPERLHRVAGTLIYAMSLLLAYRVVDNLLNARVRNDPSRPVVSTLVPIGWYLAIALGVPLMDRAWRHDGARFLEHAVVVLVIGAVATALVALPWALRARYGRHGDRIAQPVPREADRV